MMKTQKLYANFKIGFWLLHALLDRVKNKVDASKLFKNPAVLHFL